MLSMFNGLPLLRPEPGAPPRAPLRPEPEAPPQSSAQRSAQSSARSSAEAVSYTHLTLPTICSV
eukprot:5832523-Alexandrium_andersonii.AAC.1